VIHKLLIMQILIEGAGIRGQAGDDKVKQQIFARGGERRCIWALRRGTRFQVIFFSQYGESRQLDTGVLVVTNKSLRRSI
jgi:hypothetical protein